MKNISMGRAEKAAIASGIVCALFAGCLLYGAVVLHSVGCYAGGILTVSRSVTGFLVAGGIGLARRRTKNFNLGLYKVENLVVTIIGILVLFGAYELGRLVFFGTQATQPLMTGSQGIIILLFASLLSLAMAIFKNKVGKSENCPSLCADARHSFVDALAMFLIAAGVSLSATVLPGADWASVLLVAMVAFWNGGRMTIDGARVLLDATMERGLLEEVKSIVKDDPRIRDIIEIEGRDSGSHRFFSLKLVPLQNDLQATSEITKDLRNRIAKEIRNTGEVSIEYGTERSERQNVALPIDARRRFTDREFSETSRFAVFDVDIAERKVFRERVILSPCAGDRPGDGIRSAVMLARQNVDAVVLAQPLKDKDTEYTLEAYGIRLFFVSGAVSPGSDKGAILRNALKDCEEQGHNA